MGIPVSNTAIDANFFTHRHQHGITRSDGLLIATHHSAIRQ